MAGYLATTRGVHGCSVPRQIFSECRTAFASKPAPTLECVSNVGAGLLAKKTTPILLNGVIVLELVFDVLDLGPAVGRRQAVFTEVDEDHFLDREDALAGDLVAHFAGQGDRGAAELGGGCLLYTSPSPRDGLLSRMPSSA